MQNCSNTHFILGNDYLIRYQINLHNDKDRYFTIGDNKHQRFAFLPFKIQITVNKVSPVNLEFEKFKSDQPYPQLLRRRAYPESPKSREALETNIKEPLDLCVMRNLGHNEQLEITTPVIVAWHNGKSRMVGCFRALNTYTAPDRCPIPKIQVALTQISQAVYITTMDALKGFQQNVGHQEQENI
ncbi:hypothetical protein O181_094160 [Austropuccinia psidii MF-1]|uniref:Uncharacterized protein n=1 Tax=Austropuccinia psidii MF-1 TaxID=1389203 RepID=A0A9Q3J1K3_9BASI|nr:hypothetical protein [Austropuccinia psidii MF-1]